MFSLLLNGELHLAPIGPDPQRILDLGTGTISCHYVGLLLIAGHHRDWYIRYRHRGQISFGVGMCGRMICVLALIMKGHWK
jgi:hypothetical protein